MRNYLKSCARTKTLFAALTLAALWAPAPTQAQEIIVDNSGKNTRQIGDWKVSSGPYPYLGDSLFSRNLESEFRWIADVPSGEYEIYAWWTYHRNRSNDVPYRISWDNVKGGYEHQVNVDQGNSNLGGQWNKLGEFVFYDSGGGDLIVSVSVSGENGQASADAVRFVRKESIRPWPATDCPCDEYFGRALDLYAAWGGSLVPQGMNGEGAVVSCESNTPDHAVNFQSVVNSGLPTEGTVSVRISVFLDDGDFHQCRVSVRSTLHPTGTIYDRELEGINGQQAGACYNSVHDLCLVSPE